MSVYFDHISQVDRQNMSVFNIMKSYDERDCEKRSIAIYGTLDFIEPTWISFSTMFNTEISMRTLKHDGWFFRLTQKRSGYPVKLIYHHSKHNYCFRFKSNREPTFLNVNDCLVKLTSASYFSGFNYYETTPIIQKETVLVRDLQCYSSLDLLNELEKRYKNQLPNWFEYTPENDKYIEQTKKLA